MFANWDSIIADSPVWSNNDGSHPYVAPQFRSLIPSGRSYGIHTSLAFPIASRSGSGSQFTQARSRRRESPFLLLLRPSPVRPSFQSHRSKSDWGRDYQFPPSPQPKSRRIYSRRYSQKVQTGYALRMDQANPPPIPNPTESGATRTLPAIARRLRGNLRRPWI